VKFGHLKNPVVAGALVLVALTLYAWLTSSYLSTVTEITIYALYGAGIGIMLGYTGLAPFGASVFFGTATYAVAVAATNFAGNEIAALGFGIVFSIVLSVILGALVLLRRGLYFSLLTLASSQIAFEIAYRWISVTGGENGLQGVKRTLFVDPMSFQIFCLVCTVAILAAIWQLGHSPLGRVFQAIRENEDRARSLGYNVYLIKLASFSIAGTVIGFGGGLLVFLLRGAYADNLSWQHAGDALLANVLGGTHHFLGPLWGAIVFIVLQDKLSAVVENWWLIFAPIVIVLALFAPRGLHDLGQRLFKRPRRYTMVKPDIPARPATIAPYVPAAIADDSEDVLEIRKLSKNFGAIVTAREIDLRINPRGLHSLIGPNGAGKTTLFNLLTGVISPSSGKIFFKGKDITRYSVHHRARLGIGRSFQIVRVFPHLSAFENVRIAVQAMHPQRYAFWYDAYRLADINSKTWSLLAAVGMEDRAEIWCSDLAHGEQRLLEIAVTLATDARILLLDEPLAGLSEHDRRVVADLILRLSKSHAVFLVEHDIDRVLSISDRITVLHQGELIADGKPDEIVKVPEVVSAYLGKARGERRVTTKLPKPSESSVVFMPRTGPPILKVTNVVAGYDGSRILDQATLELRQGEVIALLGRNGVGKTTMLRSIVGVCKATSGEISLDGQNLIGLSSHQINRLGISLVPQGRRLFLNLTVAENLQLAMRHGGASFEEIYSLFPKLYLLKNAKAQNLSGGERQMVAIARALMVPNKVILFDEPFEGLAPAVVDDILAAIMQIRSRASMVIVEHDANAILQSVDRAYIMANGAIVYSGSADELIQDEAIRTRYLGVTSGDEGVQRNAKING
jgi:ABC-type branched-subunit amino acid transport system ATPase component/ABC-type branched-subunit amino acid transport system permease subunit